MYLWVCRMFLLLGGFHHTLSRLRVPVAWCSSWFYSHAAASYRVSLGQVGIGFCALATATREGFGVAVRAIRLPL